MRLPRDLSGADLVKLLSRVGYKLTRQTGGHMRLTARSSGEHHVTIPLHKALKLGTLNNILESVAEYLKISKAELARRLFEK